MTKNSLRPSILVACMATILAMPAAADCLKVIGTEGGGTSLTMDPAFNNLNDDSYQQNLVFNKLVNLDPNFQPIPELAKSWSVSEDGRTWTFTLEEGVAFHDGKPLTAADVAYTFKRLLDPATASPGAALLSFLDPTGIVAVDELTLTMTTSDVVAELPLLISNKHTMIVQDGATSETLKSRGVGTGPFVQDVYDLAQDTRIFQKNPSYWRDGLPLAECIDLKVITEEVSRIAAIQGGSVDLNTADAGPGYVMLAQVYQQMAADAGITVNIVNNPADSYWDVNWMKTAFFSSSWNGRSVPEALAYTFTSGAEYNEGRWNNPEFDALVTGARIETDSATRTDMIRKAQEILSSDGGIIIPAFFVDTAVLRTGCTSYVPHPSAAIYNFESLTCGN